VLRSLGRSVGAGEDDPALCNVSEFLQQSSVLDNAPNLLRLLKSHPHTDATDQVAADYIGKAIDLQTDIASVLEHAQLGMDTAREYLSDILPAHLETVAQQFEAYVQLVRLRQQLLSAAEYVLKPQLAPTPIMEKTISERIVQLEGERASAQAAWQGQEAQTPEPGPIEPTVLAAMRTAGSKLQEDFSRLNEEEKFDRYRTTCEELELLRKGILSVVGGGGEEEGAPSWWPRK